MDHEYWGTYAGNWTEGGPNENFTVIKIHEEEETKECGLTSAENLLNNLL